MSLAIGSYNFSFFCPVYRLKRCWQHYRRTKGGCIIIILLLRKGKPILLERKGGLAVVVFSSFFIIFIGILLLGKGKTVLKEGLDRSFTIHIPFPSPLTLTFFLRNSSPKLNSLLINPPLLFLFLSLSLSLFQLFNLAIKFFVILRGKVTPTRYFVSSISGLFTCIVGINLFLFPYLTISLFP